MNNNEDRGTHARSGRANLSLASEMIADVEQPATANPAVSSGPLRVFRAIYVIGASGLVALSSASALWASSGGSRGAWVIAALPLVLLALGIVGRVEQLRRYSHLPGPKPCFLLGNLEQLLAHEHGGRDQALVELHRRHGPIIRLHLGLGSRSFVSTSYVSSALRGVASNRAADRTVMGDSLMGAEAGPEHEQWRRALNPHFRPAAVRERERELDALNERSLEPWSREATAHGSLMADLQRWAASVVGRFVLAERWEQGADRTRYLEALEILEREISFRTFYPAFVRWLYWRRALEARAARRYLRGVMAASFEGRGAEASTGGPSSGCPFHRGQSAVFDAISGMRARFGRERCLDELIGLIAGGTNSMSYTVSQALERLAQHPDVAARARRSVDAHVATAKRRVPAYVQAIVHETMRLHPPVPFSSKRVREGVVDCRGFHIPGDTNLMWMKTAIGLDPRNFHDPERFDPERFIRADGQLSHDFVRKTLPFGVGVQHCVGSHLAQHACSLLLAQILERFEIQPIEGLEVEYEATVSVAPSALAVRLLPYAAPAYAAAG